MKGYSVDIFYAKAAAYIAAAIAMSIGSVGPALGQGFVGMKACENIGKYPQSSGQIRTTMILGMSFIESSAIYNLMISGALLYLSTLLK